GLFTEPGVSTVNRIEEGRGDIEKINQIVDLIDTLSFLRTVCQGFNTIRSLVSNLCIIIKTVRTVTTLGQNAAEVSYCSEISALLNKIWYGVEDEKGTDDYGPDNKPGKGEKLQGVGFAGLQSEKKFISLGFWCDLYLCTGCKRQWEDFLGEFEYTSFLSEDLLSGLKSDEGDGTCGDDFCMGDLNMGDLKASFNPMQSLPVAIFCMPPCLTGIKNTLLRYKQILVNYNVCMNVAAVRGEGSSQCEEYKASQTCRWVVGWFWSWVEGAISSFITGTIMNWIDEGGRQLMDKAFQCNTPQSGYEVVCSPKIIYAALGFISAIEDIKSDLNSFKDLETNFNDENDVEEDLETELENGESAQGEYPYK
ncbi:MAG: hypothetical protein ACQESF_04250, partial [Nanobdellota archaeon]